METRIITKENMMFYPLSGLQMQLLNPTAKIITYDQLNDIKEIRDLFKDTDQIICLILIDSKYSGHWICLFKNQQGYNFYDSYGMDIDNQLELLSPQQRKDLNEKENRLKKLFKNYLVIYNNVKMQDNTTETCGQHCTFRLHNKCLTAQQYVDFFLTNNIKNPDYYVANYVFNLIQKKISQ